MKEVHPVALVRNFCDRRDAALREALDRRVGGSADDEVGLPRPHLETLLAKDRLMSRRHDRDPLRIGGEHERSAREQTEDEDGADAKPHETP